MKRVIIVFCTVLLFSGTGVYAELHDRGNGLINDDVLNITWLRDTMYARTSGYDEDGSMNWYEAMEWVDQLEYGGYDDWRLRTSPGGAGYNVTGGEMGHLYYVTLGNLGYTSPEGITPQSGWGFNNQGPFLNAQTGLFDDYWSSTENSLDDTSAWNFRLGYGRQHTSYKVADDYRYAWAVREGDVELPKPKYTVTDLGTLGGRYSTAEAINIKGYVAGYSETASGDQNAFLWTPKAGIVNLGTLGGTISAAYDISDSGVVAGESTTAASPAPHAFCMTVLECMTLEPLGEMSVLRTASTT